MLKKHLKLLGNAFFKNLQVDTSCEFGSIGLDSKRPFGNSSVEIDILEIIKAKPEGEDGCYSDEQYHYARDLYFEKLIPFLKKTWQN
jgi:hypothetical protein